MLNRLTFKRIGFAAAGLACLGGAVILLMDWIPGSSIDEDIADQLVYFDHCAVCHAPDGSGVEYQGLPLVNSTFMKRLTDEELKVFIMVGRPEDSPDSQMEEPMLPVDYLEEPEYQALIRHLGRMNSQ